MDLVIACALEKEASVLHDYLNARCNYLVTGMGARRTETALEKYFEERRPDLVLFTGTAGQLDPSLEMGRVVFPEAWCLPDGSSFPADPQWVNNLRRRGWEISGRGLTVSQPVVRRNSRLELHQKLGVSICDMEAAVALKTSAACGVPCLAPKVISDTAESALIAFWVNFNSNVLKLSQYLNELIPILDGSN